MDIAATARYVERWERRVPWLYLDSRGYVTAAVGYLLTCPSAARSLPWVTPQGQPATPESITDAFKRIAGLGVPGQPQPYAADHFAPLTDIRLPDAAITRLTVERVQGFVTSLSRAFPDFDRWPAPAQTATLDWVFNAGVGALLATQHLAPALRAHRWEDAANACHRAGDDGTPDHPTEHGKRNAETKRLYLQAAGVAS